MIEQTSYNFLPFFGEEKKVLNSSQAPGSLYFTTDTGKIYLDLDTVDKNKVPIGGNVNLYYGQKKFDVPPADDEVEFTFYLPDEIMNMGDSISNSVPGANDLILNSDGCFYKVIENNIDTLRTEKLTIAGTGGGSSSGPSIVDPNDKTSFSISSLFTDTPAIIQGSDCFIKIAVEAHNDIGEYDFEPGSYKLYINNSQQELGDLVGIKSGTITDLTTIADTDYMNFNIGPYLKSLKGNVKVTFEASHKNGGKPLVRVIYIDVSNMVFTWNPQNINTTTWDSEGSLELEWTISGSGITKNTYLQINDKSPKKIASGTGVSYHYSLNFKDEKMDHGVYTLKMWVEGQIGKTTVSPDPVYKNIFVVNRQSDVPLISVELFNKNFEQYNTVTIPVIIYNPQDKNTNRGSTVFLYEGTNLKDTWSDVRNLTPKDWVYTPMQASNDMSLRVSCIESFISIPIIVNPLKVAIKETPGYAFKFKATDFTSNNNVQNWEGVYVHPSDYESTSYSASFSDNFDWINGGLQLKENEEQKENIPHILIKAGTHMTINYPIWKYFAPVFGKHLKIIFKTKNCKNYDAQILSCKTDKQIIYTDKSYDYLFALENLKNADETITYATKCFNNNGIADFKEEDIHTAILDLSDPNSRNVFKYKYTKIDNKIYQWDFKKQNPTDPDSPYYAVWYLTTVKDSFNGFSMTASEAEIKSNTISLNTYYCDDEYIELEMEITSKNDKHYVKLWIDGIPSNYIEYNSSDEGFFGADKITIGSNDCDVLLYQIKFYESELDIDEHMDNFYADAPSGSEMVARFNRNNIIYDGETEIDPFLVAEANPDCLVHIYEITPGARVPTYKGDLQPCTYKQYQGSGSIKYESKDAIMNVQGTSSEAYVLAAANLDTEFKSFTDASGNELPGWSMTEDAYPINYACTKVNVASCENANNAINQEWYNLFQPYKSVLKCKNELKKAANETKYTNRDTMQFTNGVIFIKDTNQSFDKNSEIPEQNNVFGEVPGYIGDPYAKFYSIGQMGNSKNNIHVFHDETNPLECCVEVKDNQMPQQQMIDYYPKDNIGVKKDIFEFRYPKQKKMDFTDSESYHSQMRNGWSRLIDWFVKNDPSPKYNKHDNITTQQQFNDFAINKITQESIPVWRLNDEKTKYELTDFNADISTYYTATEHIHGYDNLPLPNDKIRAYGSKTFTTIRADAELQKDYVSILNNFTTSEYNYTNFANRNSIGQLIPGENDIVRYGSSDDSLPNGFIRDTYEYRMAKMLFECEDYLIMESIIYHFLFIERHCMIDNVAKNTFWSTEDCVHWNLIKDYDNDTSDGNDNNGHFTRTYGMEPLDKLNQTTHVFNAHQSAWFNFINGLKETCSYAYTQLESKTVTYPGSATPLSLWSAKDYLWLFNKWQKMIPERCWIEDYQRKYFRPYEIYNKDLFNPMIEGGTKKFQRAFFEKYQEIYMASKYGGALATSSKVWMRPTGTGLLQARIPVKVYADCYVRNTVGGQASAHRLKRGEWGYFSCPVDNVGNATMDISPASLITHLGEANGVQLGDYLPDVAQFASCPKLQELYFASEDKTLENTGLTEPVSFNNNPLLEKLHICNLKGNENPLNLNTCTNLIELDGTNSAFTSIEIADNAPITTLTLESPTELTLSNLKALDSLTVINSNYLSSLKLHNIDTKQGFSKILVEAALKNDSVLTYKLTDVKWTLSNSNELHTDTGKTYIHILDKLLDEGESKPVTGVDGKTIPKAQALTGTLTIPGTIYNDNSSIGIYNTYITNQKFANLDMNFTGPNATLCNIVIYDGNGKVLWKKCIKKNTALEESFYDDGPFGAFTLNQIYKSDSADETYSFGGQWLQNNSLVTYTKQEGTQTIPILPTFKSVTVDIHLYPQFTPQTKQYKVAVCMKNPITNAISTFMEPADYKHGTSLQDIIGTLSTIPYVEDPAQTLGTYEGYDLVGYSSSAEGEILSLNYTIKDDITLWAIFDKVDDIRTIVHPEWFVLNPAYGGLSPKKILGGKITIPAMIEGQEAKSLNNFYNCKITHIFLQDDNKIESINKGCFSHAGYGSSTSVCPLVYFDFVKARNLITVGSLAFGGVYTLETYDFTKTQLTTVEMQGFNAAFSNKDSAGKILKLPGSFNAGAPYAFANNFEKNNIAGTTNPELVWGNDDGDGIDITVFANIDATTFNTTTKAKYKSITIGINAPNVSAEDEKIIKDYFAQGQCTSDASFYINPRPRGEKEVTI